MFLGISTPRCPRRYSLRSPALETAHDVWMKLSSMFSSVSKSRIIQLRAQLAREQKGDQTVSAYYTKMTSWADELAAAGKPLDDEEMISYILAGLDSDYNPLVSSITRQADLSLSDLYADLLSFDAHLESQHNGSQQFSSSANAAARSRGRGRGRNRGGGRGDSSAGRSGGGPNKKKLKC